MSDHDHDPQHSHVSDPRYRPHCCPCGPREADEFSRRGFLGGMGVAALGGMALAGLSWSTLSAGEPDLPDAPKRKPLVVKPVFLYETYARRPQTSWRMWGGIQTQQDVDNEIARINGELKAHQASADFPLTILPLSELRTAKQLKDVADVKQADALLVYAANGDLTGIEEIGKPVVLFVRHKSGPLSFWYEIVSPRYLRQNTDRAKVLGITHNDVVVDKQEEVLWRLRGLCGLANTMHSKIVTVGGAGSWCPPPGVVPDLVRKRWKIEMEDVSLDQLGKLIVAARSDHNAVNLAKTRADEYLKLPGTSLETEKQYVENAMLLDQILRKLMAKAGCRAVTIQWCFGPVISLAETTACMALSKLNDDGYQAFCESDFVVIPAGLLLTNISGKPMFLSDPTYPNEGLITLAHCTGPRKMDGKTVAPVRILSHFESDYGAAPKVQLQQGQLTTNILADFKAEHWVGVRGEIASIPFLPICRCQVEMKIACPDELLAERMRGFHWITGYGDYTKEIAYALRRIPIEWEVLG